jgi:hypothetical protein
MHDNVAVDQRAISAFSTTDGSACNPEPPAAIELLTGFAGGVGDSLQREGLPSDRLHRERDTVFRRCLDLRCLQQLENGVGGTGDVDPVATCGLGHVKRLVSGFEGLLVVKGEGLTRADSEGHRHG